MSYFDGPQMFGGPQMQGDVPPMDPNAYAQRYATEKGISLNEAKEQLRAKYGDPQQPQMFGNNTARWTGSMGDSIMRFSGEGANFNCNPFGAVGANSEQLAAYVKKGAERTGLSEKEFAQRLGLPDRAESNDNGKTQKLRDLGIPQKIIDQGDDAIRKYAKDHNIDLPAKEKR